MIKIIDEILELFVLKGSKIFLIIFLSFIIFKIVKIIIRKGVSTSVLNGKIFKKRTKVEEERIKTIKNVLNSTLKFTVVIFAILTILPELNINIGPLLAGAGIAGIAIGMGARNMIQDYFSGIFILLEDQYRVGEEINILGIKGIVLDFNLRRTVMRGEDNSIHIIPNGQIIRVNNLSRK